MALRRTRTEDRPEPLCRLVRFEATDGVALTGALYEPKKKTTRAIVFLHGNGGASVFEARRTNVLAAEFLARGFAYLPFNNRGAHLMKWLRAGKKRVGGGMAYERIRDAVPDIDGAARELRRRGYRELYLVGHSTGANKIAVYDHYKPRNPFKRYVLLAGGDDSGMFLEQLGERRVRAALQQAREMIRDKRGDELVPRALHAQPLSWRSFLDMANPDGDYNVFPFAEVMLDVRMSRRTRFRYVRELHKPALFLYGDSDEHLYGDVSRCVAILADAIGAKPHVELAIMEDADHGFGGREAELARIVSDWLV